ncbi:hypothetical protein GQ55_4G116000 [Panicum hallii var. hallii]|uniref:Uncharacterized protein n=1 Tax=Panicum hallii var. hallii TaxID=1504633 RepID=A0A2T7DXN4_9POAL|nr:hypothetical protein GQ55_4G116000 [Panicum hallii var. hallii]
MWCRNTWLLVKIYEVSCVRWQISTRAWLPLNFEEHLLSMASRYFQKALMNYQRTMQVFFLKKSLYLSIYWNKVEMCCLFLLFASLFAGLRARPRSVAASLTTGKAPTGSKLFLTGSARSSPTPSR